MRSFVSLRPGSRFRSIYRSGSRRRVGGVTILQSRGISPAPEVGVVAGRSVGNAVQRNLAKRRLREVLDRTALQPGRSYVVVATREVLDAPFEQLSKWVATAVSESGPRHTKDSA